MKLDLPKKQASLSAVTQKRNMTKFFFFFLEKPTGVFQEKISLPCAYAHIHIHLPPHPNNTHTHTHSHGLRIKVITGHKLWVTDSERMEWESITLKISLD